MNGFYWITRVPETLDLARVLIQATPDRMTSRGQARFISVGTRYADVAQRWVTVYSPEAYQRATKTVNKASPHQTSAELTAFEQVCRQTFSCETDAYNALSGLEKKLRPGIAANFGEEGVIYIIRLPKNAAISPQGWQGLQLENEYVILNKVPPDSVVQMIPASQVAPLTVNDMGLLVPGGR